MVGKSSIWSGALRETISSNTWSTTQSGLAEGLSNLFTTTITGRFFAMAFLSTK